MGLIFALFTTSIANAQLLFNENFTGYTGGNLTGQGSWQTTNNSGNQIQVVQLANNTNALYKAGYTSGTNYITVDNSGRDYYKNFLGNAAPSISSDITFYYSFVVRVPSTTGTGTQANATGVLGFRTGNNNFTATFVIGDATSGSNLKFGISTDNSTKVWSAANYLFNTTYLIVIRYDAVPGAANDRMYMWVNPPSLSSEAAMGAAAASTSTGLGYIATTIDAFQIVQGAGGAEASFDGFRAAYGNGNANAAQNAAEAWVNLNPIGAPLPVKFSGFDAKKEGSGVRLTWNVETEENLAGDQVEKSNDGTRFSTIGTVQAEGRSSYSFVDAQPLSGKIFYRIKSLDIDGKYQYSPVVSLNGGKSSLVLKAFPLPVVNKVTIQHTAANALTRISISAEDGRIIKSIVPANGAIQTSVDLSSIKAGLYFVRFDNGNGEVETLKIMKQ